MVSGKWKMFGVLVGQDWNQLVGWESELRNTSCACWSKVMVSWLEGDGGLHECKYPTTWRGVLDLLADADFSEVASKLERVLGSIILPTFAPSPRPAIEVANQTSALFQVLSKIFTFFRDHVIPVPFRMLFKIFAFIRNT